MPVRWISRETVDEKRWEACTRSNPQTDSVCAQTWYLDCCGERWDALVEDDYRAVMPVFHRKKNCINYIYPPFYTGQLGILGQPAADVAEWIAAIPKKFIYKELAFNAANRIPDNLSGRTLLHRTCLLPLNPDYVTLRSGYSQNHLRNLKKAESAGLQIIRETEPEEVIRLFRNHRGQAKNVGYREHDYQRLLQLLHTLQQRNAMETWGVKGPNGELCAAAFFPFVPQRYTFLFSGRSTASEENRAMFLLMDNFIRAHAGSEAMLDFNGSNNPAVARFYLGFGAEPQEFRQLDRWF